MNDQLNAGATSETAQNMKDNTHQAHTQSSQQGEYGMRIIMMAKWYSGNHGGLKLPDICLIGEEKYPKKLVSTGDGTWARCMTAVHATVWSTAEDQNYILKLINISETSRSN